MTSLLTSMFIDDMFAKTNKKPKQSCLQENIIFLKK